VYGSIERVADPRSASYSEMLANSTAPETFEAGHENFLIMAVQAFYFYGEEAKAQTYYDLLRRKYSHRQADRLERYRKPLDEFVLSEFIKQEAITSLDDARTAILGLITQYINDGLVNGRTATANRFMNMARTAHKIYQSKQEYRNVVSEQSRMGLPAFDEMLADAFTAYLKLPPGGFTNPIMKARAWHNAPEGLRQRVFDQVRESLYEEARQFRLLPEVAFAEPAGMEAYRKAKGITPAPPPLLRAPEPLTNNPIRK
jgi:hypothetical protein